MEKKYPECEKMKAVSEDSQKIGETADGTWDELVKTASALATGVKGKICGYDGTLCNLVKCNMPEVRMTANCGLSRYCQKMDDRV